MPAEWIRKQTLVNAERYITAELKEYEEKILGAQDKIAVIEQRINAPLWSRVSVNTSPPCSSMPRWWRSSTCSTLSPVYHSKTATTALS